MAINRLAQVYLRKHHGANGGRANLVRKTLASMERNLSSGMGQTFLEVCIFMPSGIVVELLYLLEKDAIYVC